MTELRSLHGRLVLAVAAVCLALIVTWVGAPQRAGARLQVQGPDPGDPCPSGAPLRSFNVSLTNIPLFLNRFGDVVPEGRMYVLDEMLNEARITYPNAANPFLPKDIIEPLVLRVNRGDCVQITFTNRLNELPHTALQALPPEELNALLTLPNADPEAVQKLVLRRIFSLPGENITPAESFPDFDFDPGRAPAASMHFDGLLYDVKGSDGTAVGHNPNSTVPAGLSIVYRLYADQEGEFQFRDGADMTSHVTDAMAFNQNIASNAFGAFGAIIVEPPGAEFLDCNTGEPIVSGARCAIIRDPGGASFREFPLFMHDEIEAEPGFLTRFCRSEPGAPPEPPHEPFMDPEPGRPECVAPDAEQLAALQAGTLSALGGGDADALVRVVDPVTQGVEFAAVKLEWFGFNYRSELTANRENLGAAFCISEECSLSSWPYGDPGGGDLVIHGYRSEPMAIRLFHGAEKETHTFHWHIHRWPFDPQDEGGIANLARADLMTGTVSNQLDVQAVTPGAHYTLVPEGGAGSQQGSFGDVIFHCHLYPHFGEGMWGLHRVHDTQEIADPTVPAPPGAPVARFLPDGEPVLALVPVPATGPFAGTQQGDLFSDPPDPTPERPGFPFFIPGTFGVKAPFAPLSVPSRMENGPFPPTELEQNASLEPPSRRIPGAFFVNPCPDDPNTPEPDTVAREVFDVAAIQLDVTYNAELGWHNPQHRMYVLQEDKTAVLSGQKRPEPYSPLFNAGDCIHDRLTNEFPEFFGGTVFDRRERSVEVSIHNHLVQFDVLSSDGTSNGWNYDQTAQLPALLGRDDPRFPGRVNALGQTGFGLPGDETVNYVKYIQTDHIRTNSFHDHMFPVRHQDNGMFGGASVHPAGCTFHDPTTGTAVRVGTVVDVRCPGPSDDYRNFSPFIEDHVPQFKPEDPNDPNDDPFVTPFGVPIFPAKFPTSPDDYGIIAVNYSVEPFEARRNNPDGSPADPANLFSSRVHGDPFTPMLRAFRGDKVKIKMFDLSFEESHAFNLNRWRWKHEPTDPESSIVQAQHMGMLESFEVQLDTELEDPNPQGARVRDYLYNYGGADDWFTGAWGIFRIFGCTTRQLQALPDYGAPNCNLFELGNFTRTPGQPCPRDELGYISVPVKRYTVVAVNADLVYNRAGEHDPNGVLYVLEQDLAAVQNGTKAPEPLVIRANAGDCVEVTLKNQLDPAKMQPHCFEALEPGQLGFVDPGSGGPLSLPDCLDVPIDDENEVPGFLPFPVSARVGMNPKLVNYHTGSDGANVGNNFDSTVAPGGQLLFRWFAQHETGLGVIRDLADVQNHLHHGLYGGLVIEPPGSVYLDPGTGTPLASGQSAVIVDPRGPNFREYVVFMESDLALFRPDGLPVPDNRDLALGFSDEADDPEDQGEFSIGYRNEPWTHRVAANPDLSLVFSSTAHGDPATPIFRAYVGDNVRFRVAQAQGKPRSTGFSLHGHRWRRSPDDPESQIAATQGQFNPTVTFSINLDPELFGGAGNGFAGDYLYRSMTMFRHLTGGQWGLFRVHAQPQPDLIAIPNDATILQTGFRNPSAQRAVLTGDLNGFERNPSYAFTDNGVFAVDQDSGTDAIIDFCGSLMKDRHLYYNYGFSLPANAVVMGIEVRLDEMVDSSASSPYSCIELSADGGVTWTVVKATPVLGTTERTFVLGGLGDLWSRSGWTAAELADGKFRVRITNVADSSYRDFKLDWIAVNVHYITP
jgi:hypothetical protein